MGLGLPSIVLFNLNYLPKGPSSKDSHLGGLGTQIPPQHSALCLMFQICGCKRVLASESGFVSRFLFRIYVQLVPGLTGNLFISWFSALELPLDSCQAGWSHPLEKGPGVESFWRLLLALIRWRHLDGKNVTGPRAPLRIVLASFHHGLTFHVQEEMAFWLLRRRLTACSVANSIWVFSFIFATQLYLLSLLIVFLNLEWPDTLLSSGRLPSITFRYCFPCSWQLFFGSLVILINPQIPHQYPLHFHDSPGASHSGAALRSHLRERPWRGTTRLLPAGPHQAGILLGLLRQLSSPCALGTSSPPAGRRAGGRPALGRMRGGAAGAHGTPNSEIRGATRFLSSPLERDLHRVTPSLGVFPLLREAGDPAAASSGVTPASWEEGSAGRPRGCV